MHRHGYKGRKLGRKRDQRRNLLKGLATSLVIEEQITTTLPKAKEALPYIEKIITKAKSGTLADKRIVFSRLTTRDAAHKLMDEMVPKMATRTSGHVRLTKEGMRHGDGALMATLSFVDNMGADVVPAKSSPTPVKKAATASKKPAAKATTTTKKTPAKKADSKEEK